MTIALNNRTYVGISNLVIERLSDHVVYNFPVPSDFVINTGVSERQQMGKNELGRTVRLRSYPVAEMPMLQIQYSHIRPELIGFKVGLRLSNPVSIATHIPKLRSIFKNTYTAAEFNLPTSGIVPSDTYASYISSAGISTALTRVSDFNTFDPTINNQFSISTTGGVKFSDNLVNESAVISIAVGYTGTAVRMSETLIGDVKITAALINTDNKVDIFEAPLATPMFDNASIQFGGEGMDLSFNLNNRPGQCQSWNLYQTTLEVSCN